MKYLEAALRTGYDNLMMRRRLESELKSLEGETFHIPYFDIDEQQIVRQRPDYQDLLWQFYNLPGENDTDLKEGDIVYDVEEVKVIESGGTVYRVNRFWDRTEFNGKVRITFDFGEVPPRTLRELPDYPLYERIDGRAWIDRETPDSSDVDAIRDRLIFLHPWSEPERFDVSLLNLNRSVAHLWNGPETLEEALEAKVQWEEFNRERERWR